MTKEERNECMREMHLQGITYADIGRQFGISRQRVFQLIGGADKPKFVGVKPDSCVYVGLRNYLISNRISINELTRRAYGECKPNFSAHIATALKGGEVRKSVIDRILNATSLTYEQAFSKEEI